MRASTRPSAASSRRPPAIRGCCASSRRSTERAATVRSCASHLAAENGKQVACLVELRARFDEARNILWANKLEDAGVHVAYGVVGLKTHTKIALVVRQEADGIRCYAHIGSGNYNSKTARLYEDWGLFTCDPAITEDVVNLFNYMTGRSRQREYNRLLVAPVTMKRSASST
ncbi:MAG: hypothetical protein U0575_13450 [Phycisphaerales bacterium]